MDRNNPVSQSLMKYQGGCFFLLDPVYVKRFCSLIAFYQVETYQV